MITRARLRRLAWFRHRDDGFTTVWVLGLSAIVLVLGIAVFDVWQVFGTQRTLTARADAAAAAAAQAVVTTAYPTELKLQPEVAQQLATERLEKDLGSDVTVTSDCSGTPGEGETLACIEVANESGAPTVTVKVKQRVDFTIFRILGYDGQTVSASGTAGPR